MKVVAVACILLALFSCAHFHTPSTDLVGTWRLVEYWNRDSEERPKQYPYGEPPFGLLVYDAAGNMIVAFAKNPQPPRIPKSELGSLPADELRAMLSNFRAYFGTYTVDATNGMVVHHVTADSRREHVGTDQPRPFRIAGDELIIGDGRTWLRRFKRQR